MSRARAGYSLFEVLLAFAIMAMILSVLLPRQADVLVRIGRIDDRVLAQDFALSRMDLLGVAEPLAPGVTDADYRDWRWRQSVTPTQIGDTGLTALRIDIVVLSADGAELATLTDLRRVFPVDLP